MKSQSTKEEFKPDLIKQYTGRQIESQSTKEEFKLVFNFYSHFSSFCRNLPKRNLNYILFSLVLYQIE